MTKTKQTIFTMMFCLLMLLGLMVYIKMSPIWFFWFFASILPVYVYTRYFACHVFDEIKSSGTKNTLIMLFACAMLAPIFYMSLIVRPFNGGRMSILVNLSFILILFVAIFITVQKLLRIDVEPKEQKNSKLDLLIFMLLPLTVYTYALMGVFPAVLSPDAIYIWTEIQNNAYNNAHPLLYVMLNKLLSLIWNYPAIMAIFQILLCSFTYAYVAWRFKKMGLPSIYCWLMILVLTFVPCNLIYSITVFKDVPYTMALILLAVEYIRIFTDKAYFKKMGNLILLGTIVLMVSLTRHNGMYVMILCNALMGLVLLLRRHKKHALRVALAAVAGIILFQGLFHLGVAILGDKYQNNNHFTKTAIFAIPTQAMIAIYHDHWDELDIGQKERLYRYLDFDEVDNHIDKHLSRNMWRYYGAAKHTLNAEAVDEDVMQFMGAYWNFLKAYPEDVLKSYLRMTSIVWCSQNYGYTGSFYFGIADFEDDYYVDIEPQVKSWHARGLLERTYGKRYLGALLWRPALPLLVILLLLLAQRKGKRIPALMLASPVFFNALGYLATCESQDVRYLYINYSIMVMLFFYTVLNKKIKKEA